MKHSIVILTCLGCSLTVQAALSLKAVRTATDSVLAAYYPSDVYQSPCFPAAVYPVLAQGGTWDETRNPFAVRPK